ncbi:hypothetical protein B9T62_06200 [Paenibacillus donghaensis]|uniref:Uncharacterized protein n=1 Tax=Paenibacillus donghaensis TaxID=414771 RepID=A0A2Z2KKL9_9BACL|nr:hypothetical protein B9T62_06200 [Paenibacillus donghaensis]
MASSAIKNLYQDSIPRFDPTQTLPSKGGPQRAAPSGLPQVWRMSLTVRCLGSWGGWNAYPFGTAWTPQGLARYP